MEITRKNSKPLSVFTLVMINIIAIDSLRNLPANAEMGLTVVFFYIIAALFFLLPCALITAELATHYPKTGGAYVWVREAFGPRIGFMNIWLQWIYNVFWYPTILSFIAVNIAYLFTPDLANQKIFIFPLIILMFTLATVTNWFGMKISGFVSTISAVAGTLIPMIFIIVLGLLWFFQGHPLAITPSWQHIIPNFKHTHNFAMLVIILFSLMGLEMSAVHAESVKNPKKGYPRALFYSALLIVTTLLLASAAITIVVPGNRLNLVSGLDQAFHVFLQAFHLEALMPIVIILIILGGFGGMAAWVIGPTKGLVVAAEDGCAPRIFSLRNKSGAPVIILSLQLVMVILLSCAFLFFNNLNSWYWFLSDLTAQLALLFYIILFAAAIRLRYKSKPQPNSFRIPGGSIGIWLVGLSGILVCSVAIIIGLMPPSSIPIKDKLYYELSLLIGIILFTLPPLVIYRKSKD